LKVRV